MYSCMPSPGSMWRMCGPGQGLTEDYGTGVFSLDMKISGGETGERDFKLEWILSDRDGKKDGRGAVRRNMT